ncbi:hypothetical protein HMN09_00166100 [Mycena chlorophos]|uniref:Uncharacterized protein n=1 Tax=Mycena chlorophos TaxID=658473 RepID=A0A8H6TQ50_MYCCL|nr:hypothetical protein HMN09_00166100 [Mycena chlorophos]
MQWSSEQWLSREYLEVVEHASRLQDAKEPTSWSPTPSSTASPLLFLTRNQVGTHRTRFSAAVSRGAGFFHPGSLKISARAVRATSAAQVLVDLPCAGGSMPHLLDAS